MGQLGSNMIYWSFMNFLVSSEVKGKEEEEEEESLVRVCHHDHIMRALGLSHIPTHTTWWECRDDEFGVDPLIQIHLCGGNISDQCYCRYFISWVIISPLKYFQ